MACQWIDNEMPILNQLFIGWIDTALVNDILGSYNKFEENLWGLLSIGNNLQTAFEESLDVNGGTRIEENFAFYGVIDKQFVKFSYPDIRN